MDHPAVDTDFGYETMTPEVFVQYLRRSLRRIYRNWQMLDGMKLIGSLFFPRSHTNPHTEDGKERGSQTVRH